MIIIGPPSGVDGSRGSFTHILSSCLVVGFFALCITFGYDQANETGTFTTAVFWAAFGGVGLFVPWVRGIVISVVVVFGGMFAVGKLFGL